MVGSPAEESKGVLLACSLFSQLVSANSAHLCGGMSVSITDE